MGQIYLIRHGQASFTKSDYDQLADVGFDQSRVLGQALKHRVPKLDQVFSGEMRRHKETAQTCLQAMERAQVVAALPGFNEFDHEEVIVRHQPRYANRLLMMAEMAATLDPKRAFQRFFKEAVARWVSGKHDGDYKESWSQFRARSVAAIEQVVAQLNAAQNGSGSTALVFTSGGPITAICQHLLLTDDQHAFALNWVMVNCGVTKIVFGERGLHLSSFNDHGHFEGAHQHLITYR